MKRGPSRGLEPQENKFFEKRGFVLKGRGIGVFELELGRWDRDLGTGHGRGLRPETRVGNLAALRVSAVFSLEPSFFSFSSLTCSGRGSGSGFRFVLFTWPIKPYPTELLSGSLALIWSKGSSAPQNEEKA